YVPPKGGGGTTNKISIGNQEFTFGHGGRHLEGTNLNKFEVENAIAKKINNTNIEWNNKKPYKDRITINGQIIEFHAKKLENGKINIGTYYIQGIKND
ncbi:hypothetical protein, partial [Campylobacter majalis]|uniref:hypothetical protein n=1 Tax=Campylobacter majalis TaxID=2790656 RepID=UPI003D688157